MAEDGISDYGYAKRKATKTLGAGEAEALPTNEEIEAELRLYQSLYQDEEQPQRLHALRRIALQVMEFLAEFRPYLTGAVLDGTAGRYAGIEIDLYADSAKDVEIALLSRNIAYEPDENTRNRPDSPEAQLSLDWDGVPVRLAVYPYVAERRQQRNPHTGRTPVRARIEAVAALLK
ncbi:MAG: hypothetical protein PHY45_09795 [Rhodocyclaceae bacterium]|nr:hypothetical protein [Rhodocyclaceae bacterium]